MAATILVVGIVGMMQAIILGSEMMATARRQTLAAKIIDHEIEKLRLEQWSVISGLPTASTTVTPDSTFNNAIASTGVTYQLSRTVATIDTDLREVTFSISWAVKPSGISASRTYTRTYSAYFAKSGLNLRYQRS